MNLNIRFSAGVISFLSLALLVPVSAQVTGSLSGRVEDPSGMAVTGVRVVVTIPESDAEEAATSTTASGAFFFPVLRPIFYNLRIEAPNFKAQTIQNVKIDPTSETSLPPIKLELGDVKTSVEAIAPTQLLQTSNGEVVNTLSAAQVSALPLFGRDPLQSLGLLDTLPGVSTNGRTVTTIDGQSVSFANITYDGINIQDNFIRNNSLESTDVLLGLHTDQISEATIVTSNPGNIYSGGSSQVAFSTPSGTNAFHGSLYWLNIPGNINAQTFFNNVSPATPSSIQLNQAGATVGGPIVKNKLFFFANFESDQDRSRITQFGFVPKVPLVSQNPTVQQILNLIPSSPSGVYTGPQSSGDTTYLGLARLDYIPSTKHAFSFSTSMNESLQDQPSLSSVFGRNPDVSEHTVATLFSGSWRWNPTPRLTNEVRIGASLQRLDFLNSLRKTYPFVMLFGAWSEPMAGIDPQGRSNRVYNYQDNLTYVIGNHSLRAGFSLQQYREWEYGINYGVTASATAPVYFMYTFDQNGNLVNNLPKGIVFSESQPFGIASSTSGYQAYTPPVTKPSANLVSGYFQDNWKALRNLSLNLGVRYDYLSPLIDNSGLAIIPTLSTPASDSIYNPNLAFSFIPKNQELYRPDRNNFAPYFGFAWQASERVPIVVRGSYSISFVNDDLLRNMSVFAVQNPFQSPSIGNGNLGNGTPFQNVSAIQAPALPPLTLQGMANFYSGAVPIPALDPHLRTPYVQQANLGVESQWKKFLFSVRYVGNRLAKGLVSIDRNQVYLSPAFLSSFKQAQQTLANGSLPVLPGLINGGACFSVSNGRCTNIDFTALNDIATGQAGAFAQHLQLDGYNAPGNYSFFASPLAVAGLNLMSNLGRSRYDSLQIAVSRRVSPGLGITANYSYSKTLSNLDDYRQGARDPELDIHNPGLDWAPSPFNLKHAFKATLVYDLPFGRLAPSAGVVHRIAEGWTISGIMIAQSGAPFSLLSQLATFNTPEDSLQNTLSSSLTAGQIEQNFGIRKAPDGTVTFVNAPASALSEPGPGQVGTLQRRMFTGPNAFNLDLGIQKAFALTERARVELRAESINLLNNENWLVNDQVLVQNSDGMPAVKNGNLIFNGGVTQWTTPRSFQFLLRVRF
jgi:Carboxypeptidase regulatory-like domain/TonB dependent receptor